MANAKHSAELWIRAREYFEAGLSLSLINQKTGIDKAAISRKAKLDAWTKGGEKQQLIIDATRLEVAKSTLTQQALLIHDEIVKDRAQYEIFFNNAVVKNVHAAMNMECLNQAEFKFRAETISKGKETVLGKAPDTAVQVNVDTRPNKIKLVPL